MAAGPAQAAGAQTELPARKHGKMPRMPVLRYVPVSPEWMSLKERVQALISALPDQGHDQLIDTLAVAESFKAVAMQLLQATHSTGQTSKRFTAVAKALDLATPKSTLQAFLQDEATAPDSSLGATPSR